MAARYGFGGCGSVLVGVVRFWQEGTDFLGGSFVEFGLEFVDGVGKVLDGAEVAD